MARKKVEPASFQLACFGEDTVWPVDARSLVTVGENDPYWTGGSLPLVPEGCILRLCPPPGTPSSLVADLVAKVEGLPVATKVLPHAASETSAAATSYPPPSEEETYREVVARIVRGMNVAPESLKDATSLLAEQVMDEVGL